ncbi:MAG: dihydrofolate reductase [Legionellaceae bacterium]
MQHERARKTGSSTISLIAAIDTTRGLGKNNQLLCHLPADLKHFKALTLGKPVVMGRKTFESIGKPLPNRLNIVVSRTMLPREDLVVVDSLEAALQVAKDSPEIMIIGGAQLFSEALELAHTLYLTHIHHEFKADVFFPAFDETVWHKEQTVFYAKDQHNIYDMSFCVYEKIYRD